MNTNFNSYGFLNIDMISPSPLRLCDFGIELRQNEQYDYNNSERGSYEGFLFQYTLEGSGIFETLNENIQLSKGKAFLIPFPNQSRYYLPQNENQTWKYFYIHFSGSAAIPFFERIFQLKGPVFSLSTDSSTVRLFFDEYNAIKNGKQYQRYESGVFLYQFLSGLLRDVETPLSGNGNAFVDEALQWIHRNYSTQMSLSVMCSNIGVSLPHLTRQFHAQKGLSPMNYLTNLRLEHSISLLLNTTLTINQIAEQCGFSNGNYYTKVFRKVLFMTPTEYRTDHARNQ
jgi:AraC family transcriptional regulator of arabinose operon